MIGLKKNYDVALSFAGEDRIFASALADSLRTREVSVFYDEYEKAILWGKDLYLYLSDLYQNQARFCVVFVSKSYAAKMWTKHELRAAQARAIEEHREYILPIRVDDAVLPGLTQTTAYLRWDRESVDSITAAILLKLGEQAHLQAFEFDYIWYPEPGLRKWYQLDDLRWIEVYPSGYTSVFVIIDRPTIDGFEGLVVRKVKGEPKETLVPNYRIELFIPDKAGNSRLLLMRHFFDDKWSNWRPLAEIRYL